MKNQGTLKPDMPIKRENDWKNVSGLSIFLSMSGTVKKKD